MKLVYCPGCLEKQRRIDELEEEVRRLKAQRRYEQRKATEGFFGSSTRPEFCRRAFTGMSCSPIS